MNNAFLPEQSPAVHQPPPRRTRDVVNDSLKRRYAAERRFRLFGLTAVIIGLSCVILLLASIIGQGYTAFQQTYFDIPVHFDTALIDPAGTLRHAELAPSAVAQQLAQVNFLKITRQALEQQFPTVNQRTQKRLLHSLLSTEAARIVHSQVAANPAIIGTTQSVRLLADDDVDMFMKGHSTPIVSLPLQGQATIIEQTGERVRVQSTHDDFSVIQTQVRRFLLTTAQQHAQAIIRLESQLTGVTTERTAIRQTLDAPADAAAQTRLLAREHELAARDTYLQRELNERRSQAAAYQAQAAATTGVNTAELNAQMPSYLLFIHNGLIKITQVTANSVIGTVLVPLQPSNTAASWQILELSHPEAGRRLKDQQIAWLWHLKERGLLAKRFNTIFFTHSASREPEQAGVAGAMMGSAYTLILTLLFSFPIAVGAAIYLEEFAPKNRWTDFIEVNINNLAAVPSVVFGLLGLAVFINFLGVPRSTPLVAAIVLALMTLPVIIISSRAALKSVPPSIREAALGIGASPLQTQFHHVLPLAMPGILTGSILGMARALGETAPLLMLGMVAFIVDIPSNMTDPATVLPVQIFLWADSPERGFVERTSAAILVLLVFLLLMNATAVLLRRRFERRW